MGSTSEYIPLNLSYSDGQQLYPTKQTKQVAADGSYEYFRPCEEGSTKDILWRTKTAKNLVDTFRNQGADGRWFYSAIVYG